jgi:predicted RNA-binding protein YlxR (DUF448 family)/ribosomal protein L7Ae-like RNA K-turn-binding protein
MGARPGPGESLRRCALSRKSLPKEDLIRFVCGPGGEIVPDLKERLPGRGVWIEARKSAVAEAAQRNAFARSFKAEVKVPQDLANRVGRLLDGAALAALALANKAGEAAFGAAKIEEAIGSGRALALVHASDAAPDGCRKLDAKFRAKTGGEAPSPVTLFTSDELGLASGRSNVIHAAVIQGGAAAKFLAAASRVAFYRRGDGAFANRTGSATDRE